MSALVGDRPLFPPTGIRVERVSRSTNVGDGDPFRSSVLRERDDLRIVVAPIWYRQVQQLLVALAFLGFGLVFPYLAFTDSSRMAPEKLALVILAGALFASTGYALLATAAYMIHLHLDGDDLRIRRRGLPWPGMRRRVSSLRSLRYEQVGKVIVIKRDRSSWLYELRATDARGDERKLATFTAEEQAGYVVDAINRLLTSRPPG